MDAFDRLRRRLPGAKPPEPRFGKASKFAACVAAALAVAGLIVGTLSRKKADKVAESDDES